MQYRVSPQKLFNFDELIIDNFAGGGGASTGIEAATGTPVDIAINHDPQAIAMHTANHPTTTHYIDNVWQVDPREVTKGQPVGLAWFSPDCKHFSKASGGKPLSPRVRGLAWIVLKWAGLTRPRIIMLENVEEFEKWGPLTRSSRPCKKRSGLTFNKFLSQLRDLGYEVETRILRACDYGAPTIRKRLFLVARRDGNPIVWPEKTHGPGLKKYKTAADIMDFSNPCPSIFDRKKPLAENTLKRIAKGIQKFVFEANEPFILTYYGTKKNEFRGQGLVEPLKTQTTENRHALIYPYLVPRYGERKGQKPRCRSANEPMQTIVPDGNHGQLVLAFLAKHFGGATGCKIDLPLPTTTTRGTQTQLVTSNLVKLRKNQFGQHVTEPMPTLTSGGGHVAEVRAFLIKYYNTNTGQELNQPLQTITTKHRFGLVTIHGQDYQIVDIGMRMLTPRELFRAQGFPDNYIIEHDGKGNKITKTQQTAKCGNSVCPPVAQALVKANYKAPTACKIPKTA